MGIKNAPGTDKYQNLLIDHCVFLTTAVGRGLFYGFPATLWFHFTDFDIAGLLTFGLCLWFLFLAVLHVLMYFGIMPKDLVQKFRDGEIQEGIRKSGFHLLFEPYSQAGAVPSDMPSARGPG